MDSLTDNYFSTGDKKLLNFPDKLDSYLKGGKVSPITLEIQPTERCNHKCPQCQSHKAISGGTANNKSRKKIDMELRILDSIWANPPMGIIISGNTGEPLLYPQINELLECINSHKIPTVLITNGELLNKDLAVKLVKCCSGIRISMDAYNAESFKYSHGMDNESWQKILENIKTLIEVRRELLISPEDCAIGVGYLTSQKTENGMINATELAKGLGVDYIQFRPFHFQNHDVGSILSLCNNYEENGVFSIYSSDQKYRRLNAFSRNYCVCHGSFFYTVLDARGDLYVCCHNVGEPDSCYGNLYEQNWEALLDRDLRNSIASTFPKEKCIPFCRLHTQNELIQGLINSNYDFNNIGMNCCANGHDFFL